MRVQLQPGERLSGPFHEWSFPYGRGTLGRRVWFFTTACGYIREITRFDDQRTYKLRQYPIPVLSSLAKACQFVRDEAQEKRRAVHVDSAGVRDLC